MDPVDAEPSSWALGFDPPPVDGLVDPVVHLRIEGAAKSIDPEEVWLVRGAVSSSQLRALARGEPSKTLTEHRVPARAFPDGDDVVVAADVALDAGAYVLVAPSRSWRADLVVGDATRWPLLSRVWPPVDAPGQPSAWMFCGDARAGEPAEVTLAPSGIAGVFEPWADARCLKFTGEPLEAGFVVPPPWIVCDGTPCALEPGAIASGAVPALEPLACGVEERSIGGGCARVEDDRLVVRAPDAPLYWFVAIDGADAAPLYSAAVPASGRFVVRGLTPDMNVSLRIRTLDAGGVDRADVVAVETLPPRPHVVLHEVYANPIGAEPAQEWVELYNDGVADVSLGGAVLRDAGGESVLPDVVIGPGEFTLLATEAFELDDGFDVPVPASCSVVRLDVLGKNGLGNSGEPLVLVGPDLAIWSRFPPLTASKAGESAMRNAPDAFDDDVGAFTLTEHVTPCSANEK